MKIDIRPNTEQIRTYARSALDVWDVLPPDLARENAIASMKALLRYLDACDNGGGRVVLGIRKIERGIRLEISGRDGQIVDLKDRYADDYAVSHHPGDGQVAVLSDVEDMGPQGNGCAADLELDLTPLAHGGSQ